MEFRFGMDADTFEKQMVLQTITIMNKMLMKVLLNGRGHKEL